MCMGGNHGIIILLTQNSSQLTLSYHHFVMHYTVTHGLKIKCLLCSRLIFYAHGIMTLFKAGNGRMAIIP